MNFVDLTSEDDIAAGASSGSIKDMDMGMAEKVALLLKIFPSADDEAVHRLLRACQMNVYEAANMLSLDIKAGQRQSIPIQSSIKAEEIDVKTAYVIPSGEKSSERGHVGANMSTAEPSHRGSDVYMSSGSRSPSPLEEDNVAEDEEDADEEDADEDNADENDVEILKNIFGHSSEICRNTLRRCHGNINTASGLLGKGCDISNMPQKRNLDRKDDRKSKRRSLPFFKHTDNREDADDIEEEEEDEEEDEEEEEDKEEAAASLKSASRWVEQYLSYAEADIVRLAFKQNNIRRVSKKLLLDNSKVLRERFEGNCSPVGSSEERVDMHDIDADSFDLLHQWMVCRDVSPDGLGLAKKQITSMIDLALLAETLQIPGASTSMSRKIKQLLGQDRNFLRGYHIEKAYELPKGNPVRGIIVKALARKYLVRKDSNHDLSDDSDSDGPHVSAAHRAYFAAACRKKGFQFRFRKQMDEIQDFFLELNKEVDSMLNKAEDRKVGRSTKRIFRDPLDDSEFSMA